MRGYVYSVDNEPLINASVRLFNSEIGTVTDKKGRYEIQVPQGLNRIAFSYIGFQSQLNEIVVERDVVKNVYLEENANQLDEVEIRIRRKDYSYEVIQNVIDNRENFLNQYKNYTAQVYIKAVEEVEKPPAKQKKQPEETVNESVLESSEEAVVETKKDSVPNMNLFECTLTRHEEIPNKQKEERTAVTKLNDQSTLFFKTITDGEFNLYENLQYVPQISDSKFISPISNLAFASYKFKLLGSYFEGLQKIYQVEVSPRKLGNALYEGTLEIYDNLWVLKSAKLSLNNRALRQYKEFSFELNYENIAGKWMATKTNYTWKVKEGSTKKNGKCLVKQSDFEFDKTFPKKFFGAELGVTEAEAYKRDTTFWASIRPEPLTKDERKFVMYKDSVKAVMNSKEYLDSVDAVYNKVTFLKVAWQGVGHINRSRKREWYYNPLITTVNPFAVGGTRVQYGGTHYKRFENRQYFRSEILAGYGFLNQDIRGNINATYLYNPFRISTVGLYANRSINFINGNATILDFIRRNNFYKSTNFGMNHRTELLNGLYLSTTVGFEQRQDLGDFKFQTNNEEFTGGFEPTLFPTSRVLRTSIGLAYTPKQLYLKEPNQKVVLGSRFPTFDVRLNKAWGGNNTAFNKFSYVEASIRQQFQVGIIGTSEYRIHTGKFLDTTRISVMDYKYQRGGDPFFFSPAMYTFQLIDETFPTFDWFLETHYTHQ
ncbi:MAG: DUF5686 and carboxypeptidase regulatory-like domain-containing protein, partial [Spirosomaceae bacterium]|nr:DUF5686 and carboxypeptidase regulatory-like domain-containing protein [Spirosomataceae bacterium]